MLKKTGDHLRTKLIAGLFLVIPLVVTYLVLRLVFNFMTSLIDPATEQGWFDFLPHAAVTWVAFGAMILVLYVGGLVTTTVLGNRLAKLWHTQVERVPIVSFIYRTTRMATESMNLGGNGDPAKKLNRVVWLDYPRPGVKSIGLVTSKLRGPDGAAMLAVYIPTSPTPNSGYLAIVKEDEVTNIDLSFDDTMRVIITAGILMPDSLKQKEPDAEPPPEKEKSKS